MVTGAVLCLLFLRFFAWVVAWSWKVLLEEWRDGR